jgi:hypothetical protein
MELCMEVEYDFTVDDAQAYSEYYLNNSPEFKKQLASTSRKYLYIPLVFVIGAVLFSFGSDRIVPIIFLIVAAILGGAYFFMPSVIRRQLLKTARTQNRQRMITGKRKQQIIVTPDKLTQISAEGTLSYNWSSVDDVITSGGYLFIMLRNAPAISVPERAFANNADFQQFAAEVLSFYRQGKT